MATLVERLGLKPDEFALHFDTEVGIDADALANLLKRAATVARQRGGDLRVVGLREGSLAVIIKAVRKSKFSQGAAREFSDKPIDTSIKVSSFVAGIVAAIIYAMSPDQSGSTPIAKAGADVVESHKVTQISIITNEVSTVVMDKEIAAEVREAESRRQPMLPAPEEVKRLPRPMVAMIEDARRGELSGEAALVRDELHFRPDGYRYWVPVQENHAGAKGQLFAGSRFRLMGHIEMRDAQPDHIVVNWATPLH